MKLKHSLPLLIAVSSVLQGAYAWGSMAHQAIGYIAQNFVSSETKLFCQNILGDTSTSYLANAATWADSYRYTTAGAFSYPYHFIDANDSPLKGSCDVEYARDCGTGGCVVSAMLNYTNILLKKSDIDALKFIIHFIGDLHQPLHDEALDLGGNTISVTFSGASTNLHHIWDTEMPQKRANGSTLTTAKAYSALLTTAIKTGVYASAKSSWLAGADVTDPVGSAMAWVQEANAQVCDSVFKGVSAVAQLEGEKDLDGAYYEAAVPVLEAQIAMAGYRLAGWLDLIVVGGTGGS